MPISDEQWADLVAKVDTLTKAAEPDPAPKTDARDVSLAKGISFFKTYLDKVLPKEKLDSLSFDELVLAAELKAQIKTDVGNPPPASKPTDKTDTDTRKPWLIPEVVN